MCNLYAGLAIRSIIFIINVLRYFNLKDELLKDELFIKKDLKKKFTVQKIILIVAVILVAVNHSKIIDSLRSSIEPSEYIKINK